MSACSCTEPGNCPIHKREMSKADYELCSKHGAYFRAFANDAARREISKLEAMRVISPTDSTKQIVQLEARQYNKGVCELRGELLGLEPCPTCSNQSRVLGIYSCPIFGKCADDGRLATFCGDCKQFKEKKK